MWVDIKKACAVAVVGITLWGIQHRVRLAASPASSTRAVVVAELFTSEGCSSCPPADEVLTRLVQRQPIDGVEVLALGEHVDYWDQLGWRDPFSSAIFSGRQSNYDARVFHRNEVYTPQLVIDGRLQRVGSDLDGIQQAIKQAADSPKAAVQLVLGGQGDQELSVDVRVDVPPALTLREPVDVLIAVAEDNLTTEVRRGENHGRTLRHSAVVRSLTSIGTQSPENRTWSMHVPLSVASGWKLANVRVIGFLQERESRRIVGAGSAMSGPRADAAMGTPR
jgi:hypothetical protein